MLAFLLFLRFRVGGQLYSIVLLVLHLAPSLVSSGHVFSQPKCRGSYIRTLVGAKRWSLKITHKYMSCKKNRGPQDNPQYTMIFIIRTAKEGPLISRNARMAQLSIIYSEVQSRYNQVIIVVIHHLSPLSRVGQAIIEL